MEERSSILLQNPPPQRSQLNPDNPCNDSLQWPLDYYYRNYVVGEGGIWNLRPSRPRIWPGNESTRRCKRSRRNIVYCAVVFLYHLHFLRPNCILMYLLLLPLLNQPGSCQPYLSIFLKAWKAALKSERAQPDPKLATPGSNHHSSIKARNVAVSKRQVFILNNPLLGPSNFEEDYEALTGSGYHYGGGKLEVSAPLLVQKNPVQVFFTLDLQTISQLARLHY